MEITKNFESRRAPRIMALRGSFSFCSAEDEGAFGPEQVEAVVEAAKQREQAEKGRKRVSAYL